ncbi:MAG: HNH endonuclease [Planctomycetaceae bacterium]|nr:HNH endonuclease [Planctomycetaceae bacterium]
MTTYISVELRTLVQTRARGLCEYCLIHSRDTYVGCQVDHIISEKHHGLTIAENLALACAFCNRAKGSDIGSVAATNGQFTRFFNPRTDAWLDHFAMQGALIIPRTAVGEVTALILAFNSLDRLLERQELLAKRRYPPPEFVQPMVPGTN